MTVTKEMERKTLEKIKQMVAELGEDSYLATAFDGVYEIAEQNIENDWGCTTREYVEASFKVEEKARKEREEIVKQIESLKEAYETVLKREEETKEKAESYKKQLAELGIDLMTARREADSYKAMTEGLECDVMKLKAKLYDYMAREVK